MAVSKIDLQNVNVKNGSTWYKLCPFPVGFVYLSSTNSSPGNTYGGTWAQLNDDRYLRCGTWGAAGSNSASHSHGLSNGYAQVAVGGGSSGVHEVPASFTVTRHVLGECDASGWPATAGAGLGGESNSATVTITPSYREVYCWYRTA